MHVIFGIDPGLASTGYGVIESGHRLRHLGHGQISVGRGVPTHHRLQTIYREIVLLLRQYQPKQAGVETLYFTRNVSSALPVAEARGVVLLALADHGVTLGEYPPPTIKQAVVGTGAADKSQVRQMVRILLDMPETPLSDHAADALAAAICHAHHQGAVADAVTADAATAGGSVVDAGVAGGNVSADIGMANAAGRADV